MPVFASISTFSVKKTLVFSNVLNVFLFVFCVFCQRFNVTNIFVKLAEWALGKSIDKPTTPTGNVAKRALSTSTPPSIVGLRSRKNIVEVLFADVYIDLTRLIIVLIMVCIR